MYTRIYLSYTRVFILYSKFTNFIRPTVQKNNITVDCLLFLVIKKKNSRITYQSSIHSLINATT